MLEPLTDRLAVLTSETKYPQKPTAQILPDVVLLAVERYARGSAHGLSLAGEEKLYRSKQSEYRVRACVNTGAKNAERLKTLKNLFIIREGAFWFTGLSYTSTAIEDDLLVVDWLFLSATHVPPKGFILRATDSPLASSAETEVQYVGPAQDTPVVRLGPNPIAGGAKALPLPDALEVVDKMNVFTPECVPSPIISGAWKGTQNPFKDVLKEPEKEDPPKSRMADILNAAEQEKELPRRRSRLNTLFDTLEEEQDD